MNNSSPPCYDTVKRFVNYLEQKGLTKSLALSDEDIADTIWLALQMGGIKEQPEKTPISRPDNRKEIIDITTVDGSNLQTNPSINIYASDTATRKEEREEVKPKREGLPFQTPAAPALLNKLAINRALRPLMRKVPSPTRKILDVEATVTRIAEQDIWLPVTKPEPERWLDLELVIEENKSSFIWEETIAELEALLHNHGAFRRFRTWTLWNSENINGSVKQSLPKLTRRKKGNQNIYCEHSYRELISSNGRSLIILLSDCVSSIWQEETIYNWLKGWSEKVPTTIMQLFPERLWLSTELGFGYKVKFSAFNPGVPNSKLVLWEELDTKKILNLPIITLEPESIKYWAKVIAGYGSTQAPGIVLDIEFIKQQVKTPKISPELETEKKLDTEEQIKTKAEILVDRFLATASPTAQELAGLMAAVPVSLPVVHLIQKTMLPESTPVNVAEVFLSGMVERKNNFPSPASLHKQEVKAREIYEYDFVPGVRKLLNQAMPLGETEKVLDMVSEYIADKINYPFKTFTALLLNLSDLSQEKEENLLPFAHVAVEVLRNLGGEYAKFAEVVTINKLSSANPTDKQPLFQLFAGEYICAVKWGGELGTWHEGLENLLISPQGEVKFRSRFGLAVIQNLTIEGQTLSWSFEHNETAAHIDFKENSENSYFWEGYQTGKLFEGWLNYPDEGRIDFRGKFVERPPLQTFEFEVATIIVIDDSINPQSFNFEVAFVEVNQSATLSNNNILDIVDEAAFNKTGQHLTEIEQRVLNGGLENLTYKQIYHQIVESANYSESEEHLRYRIGGQLWKFLTEIVGEKVNKSNAKAIIEQWATRSEITIRRYPQQATGFIQELGNDTQLEMMLIPGGTFVMGSPPEELEHQKDESPQHTVTVQSFFMAKYPVTQAQWLFVAQLPQVNRELNPDPSTFKGANRPVEVVSWLDAVEFCDRLSQHTSKPYRLPSEAEWEYACRAGTTTPFHFGETITTDLANYDGNYTYGAGSKGIDRGETTPVGSFGVANAFGLYDMHGNVWEWCADSWHSNYEGAPNDGSAWVDEDLNENDNRSHRRVLRGGSWDNNPQNCRSAIRDRYGAGVSILDNGFRVVCAAAWTR